MSFACIHTPDVPVSYAPTPHEHTLMVSRHLRVHSISARCWEFLETLTAPSTREGRRWPLAHAQCSDRDPHPRRPSTLVSTTLLLSAHYWREIRQGPSSDRHVQAHRYLRDLCSCRRTKANPGPLPCPHASMPVRLNSVLLLTTRCAISGRWLRHHGSNNKRTSNLTCSLRRMTLRDW